jgi:ribosome-associated protein
VATRTTKETTTKTTKTIKGNPRDWALLAARAADDKKAADIVVQEVRKALLITDYFVIATGANNRQVDAITEAIEEALRTEAGIRPIGREGLDEQTWVLLDYGDIVVHIFQPELREFYRLESLWSDAPFVDLEEAGIEQTAYSERVAKLRALP